MKSYSEKITVGSALVLSIPGKTLYIQRSSAGAVLNVEIVKGQAESSRIARVGKGFKVTPATGFDGIRITTSADSQVDFVVTDGGIDLAFDEDAQIIGNDDSQAIPVRTPTGEPLEVLFAGTVEPVLGVVTVDNTDGEAIPVQPKTGVSFTVEQKAGTSFNVKTYLAAVVADHAPVAVLDVAAMVVDADLARRGLRIKNAGVNPVAIGGAGIDWAIAAVILQPGETWNENEAPGAAWYAVCDTGLTSTLNLQTIE